VAGGRYFGITGFDGEPAEAEPEGPGEAAGATGAACAYSPSISSSSLIHWFSSVGKSPCRGNSRPLM
jgi:hypothetical protein